MPKALRDFAPALIMLAGSLLLTLILLLEWSHDLSRRAELRAPQSPTSAEIASEVSESSTALKGVEGYSQMVERPLFTENRRPAEDEDSAAASQAEQTPLDFKLMGVMLTPQIKAALFLDARNKYKRVRLNNSMNGWTLVDIATDRVSLEQAGERRELLLLKPKPKTAPAQPRTGTAEVTEAGNEAPAEGEDANESDQVSADEETPPDEAIEE